MAIEKSGKLEKLRIQIYCDRERSGKPVETFVVPFNPASITIRHQNVYRARPGQGSSSQRANYAYTRSQSIDLELIFDGTGVSDVGVNKILGGDSVKDTVSKFLNLCFVRSGKLHEPKFLKLSWGEGPLQNFDSRLMSVDIEYTAFDIDGSPLRAVLKTGFTEDVEPRKRVARERSQSPDVTHVRIVRNGDTLPQLSQEIYGSSKYYLQLARVNKLDHFRNLTPGTELIFPPLEK